MKNILLVICFAGLALAQNKNAATAKSTGATAKKSATESPRPLTTGAVTIPKDAVEIEPGLFQAKDDSGKVWHYTRTPFGVRRFQPENVADTTAEDASRISVAGEDNGVIKFTRKTPFGTAGWTKKKDNLNAAEKMAVERSARQKDSGAATATAAKPAL